MSPRVSSHQRGLLHDRILLRLSGIDSIWQAARDEDFASADTHAREFTDMLRLLVDDLGWGAKGEHDLELRSPPDLIARVAASILRDIEAEERDEAEERAALQAAQAQTGQVPFFFEQVSLADLGVAERISAEGEPALGGNPAVDRKWRKMRRGGCLGRIVGLITVGVPLCVLFAGCPSPQEVARSEQDTAGGRAGCRRPYAGGTGVDVPETSGLNCAAINRLTSSMPSEPETYLERGDSPRLLWKCKFFGAEARWVLLRCEHDKRHFSIVKGA